ncbi:hypothetical protein BRADI_3g07387v3, partial [Brachypodium distachyon]
MAMKREFGGLGIPNPRDLNVTLLASWIHRCSTFWKGVMWARRATKLGYQWLIGDGRSIHFWEDQWFGGSSLAIQFLDLCTICNEQLATLHDVWDGKEIRLIFRRAFGPRLMEQWEDLSHILDSIELSNEKDQMMWKLHKSGIYTSQSLYALVNFR